MSAKFVRRIIEVFVYIFVIGIAIRILRPVVELYYGVFGTLTWPVQAGAIGDEIRLSNDVSVDFTDGLLVMHEQPIAHVIDVTAEIAMSAMFIVALLALRKVLIRFAEGEFVTESNTAALRKIGILLLATCVLSVLQAVILQPMILSVVTMPEGVVLHPAISWDVQGQQNIWLHYSPPLTTFLLGGLALLFAEVFRVGTAYREDSESVV